MNFLRNLLAAILGSLVAFGILFAMFFIFLALVGSTEDTVEVKPKTVLKMSFTEPIRDYVGTDESDPFSGLFREEVGLDDILHGIKVAAQDDRIEGVSLTTGFLRAGLAQAQELRKALKEFQETGKFIYAHSDFFTQKDFYLASVADSLYLNPVGGLDFKGLATEVLYYKDLQEKTGVKMEVIRHGKYKSAVEPYLSNTMSEENREQIKALLTSLWNEMLNEIGDSRNIASENLNIIADTLGGRTPEYAVKSGLIDGKIYFDEYEKLLKDKIGIESDGKLNYVDFGDYLEVAGSKKLRSGKDKIAVIYAQGQIHYGEGGKEFIGQGLVTSALKKAIKSEAVKAIVLRINSPGGSALVSDIIWREVELAKKKKPVVVSFGNVAASGGYYIGVAGSKIFAEPTTITGSIGVFGTLPNANELAGNIGINAEQVGTNKNSVDYSLFEPLSDSFRDVIQEGIETTYETFLARVAAGRDMSIAEVDSLAQGRVWSGVAAKENGLVDELGSLDDAISAAAEMVELETYGIRKYPRYKSSFQKFMDNLSSTKTNMAQTLIQEEIGSEAYQMLMEFKQITEQKGIQARMPFSLNIK